MHCAQAQLSPSYATHPQHKPNNIHQSLMEPAREALEAALASVKITPPRVPVWSNVTAAPFPGDAGEIRKLLGRQLVEPVRWEATLAALTSAAAGKEAAAKLHELGPGQQIKSMLRRVSQEHAKAMVNLSAA